MNPYRTQGVPSVRDGVDLVPPEEEKEFIPVPKRLVDAWIASTKRLEELQVDQAKLEENRRLMLDIHKKAVNEQRFGDAGRAHGELLFIENRQSIIVDESGKASQARRVAEGQIHDCIEKWISEQRR